MFTNVYLYVKKLYDNQMSHIFAVCMCILDTYLLTVNALKTNIIPYNCNYLK